MGSRSLSASRYSQAADDIYPMSFAISFSVFIGAAKTSLDGGAGAGGEAKDDGG